MRSWDAPALSSITLIQEMPPPVQVPPRRLPKLRQDEASKLLQHMLDKKIIEWSQSPWSAPVVLVRRKDGTACFCVDCRGVNQCTRKNAYPLPRIDETLDILAGSTWFSTLDMLSGYWQVEVAEREQLLLLVTGYFSLTYSHSIYIMVLSGLHWSSCLVYLDDVIVLRKSFDDHLSKL